MNSNITNLRKSYRQTVQNDLISAASDSDSKTCPIKRQQGLKENNRPFISQFDEEDNKELVDSLNVTMTMFESHNTRVNSSINSRLSTKSAKNGNKQAPAQKKRRVVTGEDLALIPEHVPSASASSIFSVHCNPVLRETLLAKSPLKDSNSEAATTSAAQKEKSKVILKDDHYGELTLLDITSQVKDPDIFANQRIKQMKRLNHTLIGRPKLPWLDQRVSDEHRPQLVKQVFHYWAFLRGTTTTMSTVLSALDAAVPGTNQTSGELGQQPSSTHFKTTDHKPAVNSVIIPSDVEILSDSNHEEEEEKHKLISRRKQTFKKQHKTVVGQTIPDAADSTQPSMRQNGNRLRRRVVVSPLHVDNSDTQGDDNSSEGDFEAPRQTGSSSGPSAATVGSESALLRTPTKRLISGWLDKSSNSQPRSGSGGSRGQGRTTRLKHRSYTLNRSLFQLESSREEEYESISDQYPYDGGVVKQPAAPSAFAAGKMVKCPLCHIDIPEKKIEEHANACLDSCN